MLTETSDYDKLYRDFRWEVPARFNIATAACDRHADGSGRLALIYRDEDGSVTNTTFDQLRDYSRRIFDWWSTNNLHGYAPICLAHEDFYIRRLYHRIQVHFES